MRVLFCVLAASLAVFLLTIVPEASDGQSLPFEAVQVSATWPEPQEPLDLTEITPFETVGGLPFEP